MRRIILALAVLMVLGTAATLGGCSEEAEKAGYRQISQDEAAAMMESESDYVILDVRTAEEYAEKHIPGAVNIPNESIGSEEIGQLPDKEQLIMVYCRSGN